MRHSPYPSPAETSAQLIELANKPFSASNPVTNAGQAPETCSIITKTSKPSSWLSLLQCLGGECGKAGLGWR
jgi:hypothetical protein